MLEILLERIRANHNRTFLITNEGEYNYQDLLNSIDKWTDKLKDMIPGSRVIHTGGFSLENISLLIALANKGCLVIPVSSSDLSLAEIAEICKANYLIDSSKCNENDIKCIDPDIKPLLSNPGIIFFTSGSSGKPKAAIHDLDLLLKKYEKTRKSYRTCTVLLFDHLAGFDNLFYILFAGGCLVIPETFSPDNVLKIIVKHKVEVLSVTPSFLNFMLIQQKELKQNLSEVEIIVFSSEEMSQSTLRNLKSIIPPHIRLIQKYGSTEMGSPSSKTRSDDPNWIKFSPEQVEYKIENKILYLKTSGSFKGYLNFEDKSSIDDWYYTGDVVETDGEWLHILGRETDLINVGGRKVMPQEVEEVLSEMDQVLAVTVTSKEHPLMGHVVKAVINLREETDKKSFINEMRIFCKNRLAQYKIPVYVEFNNDIKPGLRMKKIRK